MAKDFAESVSHKMVRAYQRISRRDWESAYAGLCCTNGWLPEQKSAVCACFGKVQWLALTGITLNARKARFAPNGLSEPMGKVREPGDGRD
jgi:hypothetical protein